MSTFTDVRDAFLLGGFGAVLGGNDQESDGGSNGSPRPEQTPPADIRDRDNANPPQNFLMNVTQEQILAVAAGIIAIIAVIHLLKK